ncbi:MAG: phosphoribosylglycinamide formyltransferase [Candidatus Puniceispirillaceae bacterium]|jgi:phosphoribosylglycinamide formyltransferase-1
MMRIAILISGRGSNMLRLAEVISGMSDDAQIVLVAANTACAGLTGAAELGLTTELVNRGDFADKSAHEDALAARIEAAGADWVLLAGYMAILSSEFVSRFHNRIINIHPSLLPDLKGLDTHARALAAGHSRHGASVHIVTPRLDDGPILLQAALTIADNETESQLAARVLTLEHALYPFVIMSLVTGELGVDDGVPRWRRGEMALDEADTAIASILKPVVIWP